VSLHVRVQRNCYQDSVRLMQISEKIKTMPGINKAFAIMGTESNKATLARGGFDLSLMKDASPNDILFMVDAQTEGDAARALDRFQTLVDEVRKSGEESRHAVASIETARALLQQASLALISVPGEFAAYEAHKALRAGLHVQIFSDNVPLEEERKLKLLGQKLGLLVMGPDCGTSIIGGTPIGFANAVARGPVGIIGASGTGIQEISVLVDLYGSGISQAIGLGGRDLSDQIGGLSAFMALDILEHDPGTQVVVLVGKSPGPQTTEKLVQRCANYAKPIVFSLLGEKRESILKGMRFVARDMEEAARLAVELAENRPVAARSSEPESEELRNLLAKRLSNAPDSRVLLRGLYTGGSLADEAFSILRNQLGTIRSNIASDPALKIAGTENAHEHMLIDMGDDEFTVGRPHPMIDPSYRAERLVESWADAETAVILCDVVLGHGSHTNPAGPVAEAVKLARQQYGDVVTIVASVCGTERDPQVLSVQQAQLHDAGILVLSSNAEAARVSGRIAKLYSNRRQV